jgi:hypothetical protein
MKTILYTSLLSMSLLACQNNPAPVEIDENAELAENQTNYVVFGEEINTDGIISYEDFAQQLSLEDTVSVKLAGKIDKTCTVKGCWMKVNVDGSEEPMHITFKDYGFFVPKEGMEDHETVFEGIAYVDTISVDMLRHYAEDEGQSAEEIAAINEPEVVVTFEASGVLIAE